MEEDLTLEVLEALKTEENLPKLSSMIAAGWFDRVVPDWRVLQRFGRSPRSGTSAQSGDLPLTGTGLAPYGARLRRKAMHLPCSSFRVPPIKNKNGDNQKVISIFAQNGTRTHTPLPELGPEPSASTNSAIWALQKMQQGKYRPKGQRCQLHGAKMIHTVTCAQKPFII